MFDTIGIHSLSLNIVFMIKLTMTTVVNDHDAGKSSCNVRALTYCDLHKIMRDDLLEVLMVMITRRLWSYTLV